MDLKKELNTIAKSAQESSRQLAVLSAQEKNSCLKAMAEALLAEKDFIKKANQRDIGLAVKNRLPAALVDRLTLDDKRIVLMAESLLELIKLPDPVGGLIKEWSRPNGLKIRKVRVPIGVIVIIYESRPNVTAECIGLCFKSGNCAILRGGSEAFNSNMAIFQVLKRVLLKHGIPQGALNFVSTQDRRAIDLLLKLNQYIDLVIPRGGEGLIKKVVSTSRIPVIKHYKGICHVYVDELADLNMAGEVCFNAKVQRPGVCNAMESMLVHRDIAAKFLPGMLNRFIEAGVEIRACPVTKVIVKDLKVKKAKEADYRTEYLDLILSVKVVDSLKDAINHINNYGTHHSDSIVTGDIGRAEEFLRCVDSACVYHNASTRFTDGFEFGLGAEIGISTDKLHARGPMALEELTSYKYEIYGHGQVRQ